MVPQLSGLRIHIAGVVQGVGFRPFVYGLAARLQLAGWVRNTSAGVDIEVDGPAVKLREFAAALQHEAPPLARIDSFEVEERPANGFVSFEIVHSETIPGAFQPISPDVSICPDCLRELYDPQDRRYRYPFINCTNCGPRFTIIEDIPYDRPNTTMAGFPLCPDCEAEYHNPLDRRFHAQPVACPVCGPAVWLESAAQGASTPAGSHAENLQNEAALLEAQRLLASGKILAVKGLGGFHLACDAANEQAVAELRRRKLRVDKPFALMMPDLAAVRRHCLISDAEAALLASSQRPIVILRRREDSEISAGVAPGQDTLGVMLPYTPLHYLLFSLDGPAGSDLPPLVMTSGNLSEEPIAVGNDEARQRLSALADALLMHNRPIRTRCDDSVLRLPDFDDPQERRPAAVHLRRSRGYAPFPVRLPWETPPILAVGAELKNAFCLTRGGYAFFSHHIGDLENYETLRSFEEGTQHFERLFRARPEALAYDLHPDYLSTRYALERAGREGLPAAGVQHHHAHIAACLAEHGIEFEPGKREAVIGISFDGTGYGDDGAIWGGEFLIASYSGYRRAAHLRYASLPGGDRAVREPWRFALAWLEQAGIAWDGDLAPVEYALRRTAHGEKSLEALQRQLATGLNAPLTSSMGRLFDAAASLAGVRQAVNYEAQAAIEFEALAAPQDQGAYPFAIYTTPGPAFQVDPAPMFQALVKDLRARVPLPVISARFHQGAAGMVCQTAERLRLETGLSEVALSGGVWQNFTLLKAALQRLQARGFTVYTHRLAPPNDGGIALGQAAVAASRLFEHRQNLQPASEKESPEELCA